MATVTKTYVENEYSTNKSTWTVNITGGAPQTASGNFRLTPVTVTAKYVGSNKGYAQALATLDYYADGVPIKATHGSEDDWAWFTTYHQLYPAEPKAWASNTVKTLPLLQGVEDFLPIAILSSIFNETNKNTRTVSISVATDSKGYDGFFLESTNYNYSTDNIYQSTRMDTYANVSSVTLDAPPTYQLGTPSYPSPHYAGLSSYDVPLSRLEAKYGGDITSVELKVGTDSTVQSYSSTIVSDQMISVIPTQSGTYTPTLTITDSRGQETSVSLPSITINPYTEPTFNFDTYRTDSVGLKNDEGTYSLIVSTINFMETLSSLTPPIITIDGELVSNLYFLSKDTEVDNNKIYYIKSTSEPYIYTEVQNPTGNPHLQNYYENSSVTWYSSLLPSKAVDASSEIGGANVMWSDISSGDTIYGLINNSFSHTTSYSIGMMVKDSLGSSSTTITQILSTAYYTIDFQAGGKEIAFGKPANDTLTSHQEDVGLFKCGMEAQFNEETIFDERITSNNGIDIKTGQLRSFINWDGASIPSVQYVKEMVIRLIDDSDWAGIHGASVYPTASGQRQAGGVAAYVGVRHPDADVANWIVAIVNPDGTRGYSVSDPAKFREAIASNNAANLTTGTLPGARLPVLLKTQAFTSSKFTQAAGAGTDLAQTITVPSGYELVGVVGCVSAHNVASSLGSVRKTAATQVKMSTTNRTSSQWTDMTHTVYVLFALSNIY